MLRPLTDRVLSDWRALVVLALPPLLLLSLTPPGLFFDPPCHLDAYVYVGYFLHYPEHLPLFDTYYKASRLPWVLPGWVAYRTLGPVAGTYALVLGTMMAGVLGCYLAAREAFGRRVGFVAACLLCFYPYFPGNGGWNYHMTATVGYYLWAAFCLARWARSGRGLWWGFWAGAAFACSVHTHLFMVALAPGLWLGQWLACRAEGRRMGFWPHVAVLCGALALTAALGGVNRLTGGEFLFFMPQVRYTLLLSHGNHWHAPLMSWLPVASWLVLPAATTLACALTWAVIRPLAQEGGRRQALWLAAVQLPFLFGLAVGWYCEVVKAQTVLHPHFMAGFLVGPMVLVLAGFLDAMGEGFRQVGQWVAVAAPAALLFLPSMLLGHDVQSWLRAELSSGALPSTWALLAQLGLALSAVAYLAWRRRCRHAAFAALALVGLANTPAGRDRIYSPEQLSLRRDTFDFAIAADRFTTALDPTLVDIKYWFDDDETIPTPTGPIRLRHVCNSCVAVHCWLSNLLGGSPTPAPEEVEKKHLGSFNRLAVLSAAATHESYCGRMAARFQELGGDLEPQASRRFRHGELDVRMTVFWIRPPGASRRLLGAGAPSQ